MRPLVVEAINVAVNPGMCRTAGAYVAIPRKVQLKKFAEGPVQRSRAQTLLEGRADDEKKR